jgi:hypothetical protein
MLDLVAGVHRSARLGAIGCAIALASCSSGHPEGQASSAPVDAGPGEAGGPVPAAVDQVRTNPLTNAILVTWQAPENPGPPITGYLVVDESTGATQSSSAGALIAGFYGLPGGSTHCFRVYAISAAGRSPPAAKPECARAWAAEVAPPTNVRAEAIPLGARVSWDPPLPNPGPPEGNYGVQSDPPGGRGGGDPEHRSADILGLTEGATYTFTVTAFAGGGAIGASAPVRSNPVTIRTQWPAGAWRQAPSLPNASAITGFVIGRRLFFVGPGEIDSAPLDDSGAPGTWQVSALISGFARADSSFRAMSSGDGHSGFLYVSGGGSAPGASSDTVQVAAVSDDGTIGTFRPTSPLSPGRSSHDTLVVGQRLYALGGLWWSGGSYTGIGSQLPFVELADIRDDGSLTPWRKTTPLPRLGGWRAAAHEGRIYAVAPHGWGADVLIGEPGRDGGIAAWRRATAQPGWYPGSVVTLAASDGFLYLVRGGEKLNADQREVPTASIAIGHIEPDGDVTSWEIADADAFNGPRFHPAVAAGGGKLYLTGGGFSDVQWARIDPASGHLANVAPVPRPRPPGAPQRVRASPDNGSVSLEWTAPDDDGGLPITSYRIIGSQDRIDAGLSTSLTIGGLQNGLPYMFQVVARNQAGEGAASGPIDDVTPSASPLWREFRPSPAPSISQGFLFAGEELFFPGGRLATAPLDSGGMPWNLIGPGWLGEHPRNSWAQALLPRGTAGACAYEVGGTDPYDASGITTIECFEADGFLGKQTLIPRPSALLTPARIGGAAAIAGTWLYSLGGATRTGQGAQTPLDDVSFAPILSDGSIGSWNHTTPLPQPMDAPTVVVYRGDLYLIGPRAVLRASPAADGSLGQWRTGGVQLPFPLAPAKAAIAGDLAYVIEQTSGSLLVGRFDRSTGAVTSWESDPAEAVPAMRVLGVAPAPGRLYVWTTETLAIARLDPETAHPVRWR